MNRLKFDFFRHEGVILHSRDIRKAQGDFAFLTDPSKRVVFHERLADIVENNDYQVIAIVIQKQRHKELYSFPDNPYELALKLALERRLPLVEGTGEQTIQIVAEKRGKNEDKELKRTFLQIVNWGTEFISANRFRAIRFELEFLPKSMNIVGTQIADLVAYPVARHVINPEKSHPSFPMVAKKFYVGPGRIHGLKVFP